MKKEGSGAAIRPNASAPRTRCPCCACCARCRGYFLLPEEELEHVRLLPLMESLLVGLREAKEERSGTADRCLRGAVRPGCSRCQVVQESSDRLNVEEGGGGEAPTCSSSRYSWSTWSDLLFASCGGRVHMRGVSALKRGGTRGRRRALPCRRGGVSVPAREA